MTTLKSMGDLRVFLADTMQAVREGTLDAGKAGQIAKLASQINASVHAEIAARVHLKVQDSDSFNNLALVSEELTTYETPNEKRAIGAQLQEGYIGRRATQERASWHPHDWSDVEGMLKMGTPLKTVAGDYGVTIEQLESFISENTAGQADSSSGE